MSTPLKFLTGKESNLGSVEIKQGQIIFAINEDNTAGNIYHDVTDTVRINLSNKDGLGQIISDTYLRDVLVNNFTLTTVTGGGEQEEKLIAFTGTQAEYETADAAGLIPEGMIVHITDDDDVSAQATIAVSKLPAANANHRGRILLLENNDTDTPYMCLKKSGTYAWYEIQTGTTGIPGEGELPDVSGETTAKLGVAVLGTMVLGQE